VAVERLDQGTQLARQIRRVDGRKIVIGFVREPLTKGLQRADTALHAPHHQERSGQEQQALAAQGVPQNPLNQLLARLQGLGHSDAHDRALQRHAVHHMRQLRQPHWQALVLPIVKLHQCKVAHRRFAAHGRIGQGRHPGQQLPVERADFVKQARARVVFKQVASGPHQVQLDPSVLPAHLFGQGASRQIKRSVIRLVGRLHRIAVGHPGVHADQGRQWQQDPAEQTPAQRRSSTAQGHWARAVRTVKHGAGRHVAFSRRDRAPQGWSTCNPYPERW